MLDKVGGKDLPAAENEVASEKDDAVAILSTGSLVAPVKKRSVFVSMFFGLLQIILMIAVLFGSFMLAKRMIDDKPDPRKRRAFKTVYTIETVEAKLKDYQPVFTSYGQTVAARTVDLRSLVSGEIVQVNPKLRAGARIAKGEALVEIDEFNYRGALAEANANLQEAQARVLENEAQIGLEQSKLQSAVEQLEFAVTDLERIESLKERQTATQQQVETRKLVVSQRKQAVALSQNTLKVQQAKSDQQKASLLRLQWKVEQAQRNLESTTLIAPFSGIVRSSSAEIGRAITANDVVVSLYEADSMEVQFTLTDAQYGRLQTDSEGLIERKVEVVWPVAGKDWTYPATIDRLGAEITSARGGVELYAVIGDAPNSVAIRPGAFVEVRVPDQVFKNTVIVPDTALYGSDIIYTAVDGKLVENKVEVVSFEGENALVGSGLKSGDEVLVTRITEVSAGLNVRREGEATPPRAGRPSGQGNSQNAAAGPPRGRPSPEELATIAKANSLSMQEFRALPMPKRREMIGAHRAAAAAKQ
ncbi:MAG: efflux RND transporter periplasmic adaptor subunit [Rhizobiaceae bacterium]